MSIMPSSLHSADVLVVDDDLINLRLLNRILSPYYHVRLMPTPTQALESALQNPPDLIMLDIMMPGMDGFQLAMILKGDARCSDIPIVFISALEDTEHKVRAFASGGVDYVSKPFQEREVLARVRTHLILRQLQVQLQAANEELARQNEELRARNAELDAFSHTVAHDLKNPLSNMILYAQMIERDMDGASPEKFVNPASSIIRLGYKMNSAIEELMLLSGLRSQEAPLEAFEMEPVVHSAISSLQREIERAQAEIILPTQWMDAVGYAAWVEEVWINYLSNALKYGRPSKQGVSSHIELGFDVPDPPGQPARVRYWVRDNGPGLSSEQQMRLFVPFERLERVRVEGHGLGLSIVRRIIERLGGQAGVESTLGEGSLFYFILAAAPHRSNLGDFSLV